MNVIVFKTNIRLKREIKSLASTLDTDKAIAKWNVALDDSDKILRIESDTVRASQIIEKVNALGFLCEELED